MAKNTNNQNTNNQNTNNNNKRHASMIAFTKNTKLVFTLTVFSLIVLILSAISEIKSGRFIAMFILLAAFYINFQETLKLYKTVPQILSTPLRNNVLMSFGLCFTLFSLFVYISFY
jgi:hypothetical protein